MIEHWTIQQYKKYKHNSKYKNKKIIIDGIKFDSSLEANRWKELEILLKTNKIKDLRRQVRFELQPGYVKNNKIIHSINYVADFVYFDLEKDKLIIEDVKGFRTDVFKLKKKIFEYKFPNLEIVEIRKEDI